VIRRVRVDEVAALVPDGATVVADGFSMMGVADEIYAAIERSFLELGTPRELTFVHAAGQSNRVGGLNRLAHAGLLARVVGSHWGLAPGLAALIGGNEIEAVCLPQGQIATLYRAIAARRPGILSTVGLHTFVDPRLDGGRMNDATRVAIAADAYVDLVGLDGLEYLRYKPIAFDVGLIRGTRVDEDGNVSQNEEVSGLDALAIAQAVHNNGGVVICQAKKLVPRGSIPAREVTVPGVLVDYVMAVSDAAQFHRQSDSARDVDLELVSGYSSPQDLVASLDPATLAGPYACIGARGARLVNEADVVNLGVGIPGDTVGVALAQSGMLAQVTLTLESGVYGGIPLGGTDFGAARHPSAIVGHAQQFDFYNGGGVDVAFMGVGQVDPAGNVNVSQLGGRAVGCGGFMDILDGARRICFLMTTHGKHSKIVTAVDHLTFNGRSALAKGQQVYLAAEHFTLQLTAAGWTVVDRDDGVDSVLAPLTIPLGRDEA